MVYLSSFEAVNYRGINGLSLPRLSRANLVTGVNGVGKTALIEAIWLFVGRYNPSLLWNANVQRSGKTILDPVARLSEGELELHGMESGSSHTYKAIFSSISDAAHPVISGNAAGEKLMQLPVVGRLDLFLDGQCVEGDLESLQPTQHGLVVHKIPKRPVDWPTSAIESARFQFETHAEYLQRYSDMVRSGRKQEVIDALNLILPRVTSIEILADEAGESYLSAATDEKQLPLHDLGGGVVRLFRLLVNFTTCQDGILLMDEVDNGMHHSVLEAVWRSAREWMRKWNVQFFATTHSAECIIAAMEAFADAPEDLSVHHLFRNSETGNIEAVTFSGDTLEGARDLNLEMR